MRAIFVLTGVLCVFLVDAASANPILLAPSGTTLSTGQIRAEAALSGDESRGSYFWAGAGLMRVEANITRVDEVKGRTENLIGLQWNFLPETILTPAVAFGATDIASESEDGVGFYVVTTKRLPVAGALPVIKDLSGTIGVGVAGIKGLFFGLEAKLPYGLFLQAEYDSRDFNGAFGWQPVKLLRLKAYSLKDEFYLGAEVPPILF